MRFKGRKWASPFFILSLAVAGIFGASATVLNNRVRDFKEADAIYSGKIWFTRPDNFEYTDQGVTPWLARWWQDSGYDAPAMTYEFTNWDDCCVFSGQLESKMSSWEVHYKEKGNNEKYSDRWYDYDVSSNKVGFYHNGWNGNQFHLGTWTVRYATFSYNGNGADGGSTANTSNFMPDNKDSTLANNGFFKVGYKFAGWNTKADGTGYSFTSGGKLVKEYATNTTVLYDGATITLYAQWTTSGAKGVLWETSSGKNWNYVYTWQQDVAGKKDNWPGVQGSSVTIGGRNFLYRDLSELSFDPLYCIFDNGGDSGKTATVTIGSNLDGTSFYRMSDVAGEDWTWFKFTRSVTYKDQGGGNYSGNNIGSLPSTCSYTSDTTLVNGTKSGYTFGGWHLKSDCSDAAVTKIYAGGYYESSGTNVTLYAKWTAKTSNLTFNANGGSGTMPTGKVATYGAAMPSYGQSAPTKTGYTFAGYYDTSAATGGTQYYTSALASARTWDKDKTTGTTLYARWTAKTSALTFDLNGGSGTAATGLTATYGSSMPTYTQSAPTKTGYTFGGFYDGSGGTGTQYYTAELASARTWNKDTTSGTPLYAKWTANSYTVSYNNGGHGTAPSSDSATYDDDYTTASAIMGVDNYTFDHWSGDDGNDYDADETFKYNIADDLELTAVWSANIYTITLNNVDATTAGTTTIYEKYGVGYYSDSGATSSISQITLPTKVNSSGLTAVFGGYYTGQGGSGTQVINASGNIVSGSTAFTDNVTLYAKWTVTFTFDPNASQGGTGESFTKEAVLNDVGYWSIPTKGTCKKVGYKLNSENAWNAEPDGSSEDIYLWMPGSINGAEIKALYEKGANVFYANWASKESDVIDGAKLFNRDISAACDEKGIDTDFTKLRLEWSFYAFNTTEDDLYWYERSSDSNILDMLAKYDYVYGKYGEDVGEDFLGRFGDNNPSSAVNNFSPFEVLLNDEEKLSSVIIISASSISLLSISALSLLILKKRKKIH